MKKQLLTKLLLAVAMLGLGTSASWAGTQTLFSQNYQSASVVDWTCKDNSGGLSLITSGLNKYLQYSGGSNNSRGMHLYANNSDTYGVASLDNYTIKCDFYISAFPNDGTNTFQFVLLGNGSTYSSSNVNYGINTSNPVYLYIQENAVSSGACKIYVSDATSAVGSLTFTTGKWYTITQVITKNASDNTKRDIVTTITDDEGHSIIKSVDGASAKDNIETTAVSVETLGYFKGYYIRSGRYNEVFGVDNIAITTEVDEEVVSIPTISEPVYAGANRTITITAGESSEDNSVTTYYTIDGTDPSSSNYEGSFTTASKEVTITSDCTVKAITISSTDLESSIASRAVTVGMLTLNAPTIWISNLVANGGVYNATYSFASDQSDLLGSPTATLSYAFAGGSSTAGTSYTPTTAGQLIVTASAEGYTSNSTTIDITLPNYKQTYFADFSKLVKGDKSGYTSYNINNTGCDFYYYTNTFDELTLSGLSLAWAITNAYVVGLHARGGAGTIIYKEGFAAGSIIDFYCADKTSTYHIYSTTATTTIPQYVGVYNMSIYSPVVSKPITAAGWATYCSPYALNLANATGLTDAYIVTGGAGGVLAMTSVKGGTVPANTGLLLKGDEGTATIPVVASSATDVSGNKLVGVTTETPDVAAGIYVLLNDNTYGVGFYETTDAFTVGANTAYLPANFAATTARGFYSFGDATGIGATLKNKEIENKEVYNLKGQRVAAPTKGLYIVNGKKVVVK